MVQSFELRLGNYLQMGGAICSVIGIEQEMINCTDIKVPGILSYQTDLFEPIPLTPDIMEKCGFRLKIFTTFELLHFIVSLSIRPDEGPAILEIKDKGLITSLHYLHQLQNLYFALTGEELEIVF